MMKQISIALVIILFYSCITLHKKGAELNNVPKKISKQSEVINPNGSSELAILMREMTDELEFIKTKLVKNQSFDIIVDYQSVSNAKPTAEHMKNESYQGFAQALIFQFNTLQQSQDIETYNNVVNTCISCHQQSCPGPISRINKLFIYQ